MAVEEDQHAPDRELGACGPRGHEARASSGALEDDLGAKFKFFRFRFSDCFGPFSDHFGPFSHCFCSSFCHLRRHNIIFEKK